jgi:low temperature requirement protein LtrA
VAVSAQPRPWLRPPRLRTLEQESEQERRRSSWLELFFDLVFVVAVAQLAQELVRDHTLGGVAIFCGLFMPVFIAWQGFSFYADRFDTDDVLFRAVMIVAMLAIIVLAGQLANVAGGRTDTAFVLAYASLRSLVVALYLRARRHVRAARPLVERYACGYATSVAIWLLSLLVAQPLRYVLWGLGLTLEYMMPVVAQRLHKRIPINPGHVRERFALFTMIVLGESIVAVALATDQQTWTTRSAITGALAFIAVACLWWTYFDGGVDAGFSERPGAPELYTRIHIPLLLALTAVGAGAQLLIEPTGSHAAVAGAWAFDAGASLYLLCLTINQRLTRTGLARHIPRARAACAALLLATASLAPGASALAVAALSASALLLLILFEVRANLRRDSAPALAASRAGGPSPSGRSPRAGPTGSARAR